MSTNGSVTTSLSAQTPPKISGYRKSGFLFILCSLSTSVLAEEICNGIDSKSFTDEVITANTTCTVTDSISVGPDVIVGDNVFLYAPAVGFIGPVQFLGRLRVAASEPGSLNDTGIQACADETSSNLSCPVTGYPGQDAEYGRDVTHNDDSDGHAGFSFTKLDGSGNPLPPSATAWSCVQDNVTGLIWEVKTDDGGLHHRYDTYNWYNTDPATNGGHPGYADDDGNICYGYDSRDPATFCNTQAFTARVKQAGWCGHVDWRMPTRKELRTLVDYSVAYPGPTIDTNFFPNAAGSNLWSSSANAHTWASAWLHGFSYGDDGWASKDSDYFVRLVCDGQ